MFSIYAHVCVKDVQKHILCLSFEVCFSKYDADIFTSDFFGGGGGVLRERGTL